VSAADHGAVLNHRRVLDALLPSQVLVRLEERHLAVHGQKVLRPRQVHHLHAWTHHDGHL
jgi:hypothetical protein